jgi:hypothetical protein
MRDPARIPQVLKAIDIYWSMHPDLRLGQILYNLHRELCDKKKQARREIWALEDDELLEELFAWLGKANVLDLYQEDLYESQESQQKRL